jgi:Polyketide cyclase / dehydrase and lipid transport
MSDQVIVEQSVTIAASRQAVFDFVTEYSNDPQWRNEAQRMEYPRPLRVGDVVVEYSEFQGQTLVTRTALIERKEHSARLETPDGEPAHLVNVRTVTAIGDSTSHFTYRLEFDREILRPVMPQLPPAEEITPWYGAVVQAYLQTLKGILERG